jgi:hypothetical protein
MKGAMSARSGPFRRLGLMSALAALLGAGCASGIEGTFLPNARPVIELSHAPASATARYFYAYQFSWFAYDALLSELIGRCQRLGLRQMIAVIGDSNNRASIGLHAALGFHPVGILRDIGFKHGRWVDSVIMQKALG